MLVFCNHNSHYMKSTKSWIWSSKRKNRQIYLFTEQFLRPVNTLEIIFETSFNISNYYLPGNLHSSPNLSLNTYIYYRFFIQLGVKNFKYIQNQGTMYESLKSCWVCNHWNHTRNDVKLEPLWNSLYTEQESESPSMLYHRKKNHIY